MGPTILNQSIHIGPKNSIEFFSNFRGTTNIYNHIKTKTNRGVVSKVYCIGVGGMRRSHWYIYIYIYIYMYIYQEVFVYASFICAFLLNMRKMGGSYYTIKSYCPNVPMSQRPNVLTSQRPNVPTSQRPNVLTS